MAGTMELQLDNEPRSSLSIGSRFGRYGGFRREFARRFVEGIGKLAGNTLGDHRGEDEKICRKYAEVTGLAELNQLTKELVNIKLKPEFEKWREPLLWKFWRVNR
ncbi:hypothetical protein B296_00016947 [Ensete ventricosum]|uniref:Uncharacterized protein n=1 Tax=Ensete ventricosum TaxID=4639 RepID=A0A427B5H8_ENSVE|nr:hypothetical protein B296_00016947 [Ensete ventricosum]